MVPDILSSGVGAVQTSGNIAGLSHGGDVVVAPPTSTAPVVLCLPSPAHPIPDSECRDEKATAG
jgi:hypothetical protein